ncbi:MAG: DUF1018 domain-containing protein [Geobacter sp.]|nr:DUF1018 domain-containing protein [Geobacter sp.]
MSAKVFKQQDSWNRDRSRIHALKGKVMKLQPGYDDDNYRDTIRDISKGRTDSSKELKPAERQELINRLSVLAGETPPFAKGGRGGFPGRPRNMDSNESRADQLGKIEALLSIGKLPWSYADAIATAVCKVDKVAWVQTHDLYKVITALRKQAQRKGWDLSGEK